MSYSPIFSTGNADYRLVYAMHLFETNEDIFEKDKIESLDAIILERGQLSIPDDFLGYRQYRGILKKAYAAEKPVYIVDVGSSILGTVADFAVFAAFLFAGTKCIHSLVHDIKKKNKAERKFSRRDFLKMGAKGAIGLGISAGILSGFESALTDGQTNGICPTISASFYNAFPTPAVTLRNAITARKTEEYVAPLLAAKAGRKPTIALVYAGAHAGIEGCIEHKWWRDRLIGLSGITGNIAVEKGELNRVYELVPDMFGKYSSVDARWDLKEYNCNLF
jgi:hypothetical protein